MLITKDYAGRPSVPAVFPGNQKVPKNFVNSVGIWNFSRDFLLEHKGELLTLDIDFGERCSLNCPHCFRHNGTVDASAKPPLSYEETMDVLHQGIELGLKSIKILGAGEPFEDGRFLRFLQDTKGLGIGVTIFSKGHVFADKQLAQKYFGLSPIELTKKVSELGVSINLGFNSFEPDVQDQMVGCRGYTKKRNLALKRLVEAGMTDSQPTRLCLAILPITRQNVGEIFEIYQWARERNFYPLTTPSMCGGRATDSWQDITPSAGELIELYTKINIYCVERGIVKLDELKVDGVSSYAGGCPCHQVSCGMYVTSRGIVLRCPGDDVTIFGDVREEPLADIWYRSENYERRGVFNCCCPPKDGRTIPVRLYDEVLMNVLDHFRV